MREEELKFAVPGKFALPDLSACAARVEPAERRALVAVYYDTADLRLAREGITLRRRTGEKGPPWHLKLPTGTTGVRTELAAPGPKDLPPDELSSLVTAWVRSEPLVPVAELRTRRDAVRLCDADGALLAELVDDTVSVRESGRVVQRFREIEVEYGPDRAAAAPVVDAVAAALLAAGAESGEFTPKLMRALGPRSAEPPELVVGPGPGKGAPAQETLVHALRSAVRRALSYDVRVRRSEEDAVHQLRVSCRRLRSDLRTYRPLVEREWADPLRTELAWLADALGGPRDAEVLRERLTRTGRRLDVTGIDAVLAEQENAALESLSGVLSSERYIRLLDSLVDAAVTPRLRSAARPDALARQVARVAGQLAAAAGAASSDEEWHAVRIAAKRARYAAEAAAPALGRRCARFATACTRLQTVLGEHQDAALAAGTWTEIAADHADLAFVCGRLVEREHASAALARVEFLVAWAAADRQLAAWRRR